MPSAAGPRKPVVVWRPRSRPQSALIACPVFEVFFGGARGSLKTDGMLGEWVAHASRHGDLAAGLMLRRERTQLVETYERAKAIYTPLGFRFNDSEHSARGPDGSRLRFAYLERDADAEAYQGWSLTRVYVEEMTNFPSPAPVLKMMATLRSAEGVPCAFRATGNPGGAGHQWVKARYITGCRPWNVRQFTYENPWTREAVTRDRVFIPGRITDHNLLGPEYVANLQMSGSKELVRAWLEGDWDVVEGAYFDGWNRDRHVVAPFPIPDHWMRFGAFDWGYASPLSYGWWAVASEDRQIGDRLIPKGSLVNYREWAGRGADGAGPRLDSKAVCEYILDCERGERIAYRVADPSIWNSDRRGPSIAEEMSNHGIVQRRADNSRLAGWEQVRRRLAGTNGIPMLYAFDCCASAISTIPALQHDEHKPEDLDTDGDDHDADQWRYACMSRPWVAPQPPPPPKALFSPPTFDELLAMRRRSREEAE